MTLDTNSMVSKTYSSELVTGNADGNGTGALGLQDLAIKTKMSPAPGWTLKADYHWFYTAASATANVRQRKCYSGSWY